MGNIQLSPGTLFANRFEIQHAAGKGGMGMVYRARDRYSGEPVALKLLHDDMSTYEEEERFAREGRLLSELRHPGIVGHIAHGQTPDGQRFLAMEWLEGHDLSEQLKRGPLLIHDCVRLVEQIADALSIAHQRGIIHRDLKPSNLFLVGGDIGRIKILDFGIARRIQSSQAITQTGTLLGTPAYMAPEQGRGVRDLTPAADLFSIGCLLYECLTGQPPFMAHHIAAVLVRILFEEPTPIEERRPGVPAAISALLARLLAKDPTKRVADAAALRTELSNLGELPDAAFAMTIASIPPPAESFADQEQSLFSIVLAAPADDATGLDATIAAGIEQLGSADRQVLLQALASLGGSPEFLANGTLVVTVAARGSAQDQATVAARAALLIKERWPGAVVSMATGRGAIKGRTAVGEVVEMAARSLANSAAGVHLDSLSAKLLEGRFAQTLRSGGALLLYEERDVDASRPLLGKPTPCVGRDAELGTLESQLTACIDESEARVTLITAPPGVGKSRLRHEFLRRVEQRSDAVTVLLGRGDMMSAGAPYGIMRAAIHRLCGISGSEPLEMQQQRLRTRVAQNLAPADADRVVLFVGEACHVPFSEESKPMLQAARQDPKIMHYRLRQALLDLLAAECSAAPVLLVLDDLQWGDEPSVSVLDEALRTQAGAALFVLAFARPEVHEVFPKLWQSHRVQEIPLKGLSRKACERLIAQVLGKNVTVDVVARAVEQAAGNALFLEELIRSIAEGKSEEQSETVLAMLQARLGRLDANLRRTIRAASIFGQTFWRSGVATVLGLSPMDREVETWLSTLVDAEMIQSHPQSPLGNKSEYGFRHALVRDAAYGLLTSSDLTTGHRLAAEFLEAAGELDAAIIAEHFERSGERRHAARCFLRAAEDNFKQADYRGVLEHVKRGLACEPEGELRGQLCGIKGSTYYRLGQYDQIGEAGDVALKLVPVGSLGWCRAIVAAYMAAFARQDGAGASELMSLLIRTEPERVAQAEYASTLVFCLMTSLMAAPASTLNAIIQMVRVIVAQLERVDPMSRRHLCLVLALMVTFRTYGPWTLVSECQRAIDLADQAGDTEMSLGNRAGLIGLIEWGWLDLGDREGAERRLMALASMIDKTQEMGPVGVWRNQLARVLCMANDEASWAKAEQLLAPLFVPAKGFDIFSILAQGVMARISLLRGRLSEAEAQARALMPFFPAMPIWIAHSAPVQIRALLGLGRADEAVAVAVQFLDAIPMLGGYGVAEVEFRLAATEAFHAAGNIERAHIEMRETLRQIQLRADDIPDPFWKNSYLTRNPYCVEALRIAKEWGMDA